MLVRQRAGVYAYMDASGTAESVIAGVMSFWRLRTEAAINFSLWCSLSEGLRAQDTLLTCTEASMRNRTTRKKHLQGDVLEETMRFLGC